MPTGCPSATTKTEVIDRLFTSSRIEADRVSGATVFGSSKLVSPEKAILANSSAVREWDSNGTNFGYDPERGNTAGEFGHNDFYPVALAAAQMMGKDGAYVYRLERATTGSFPAEMVTAVEHNEVMVVVRTRIGRAQAVGVEIDALRHPDVLGTIAGDDTVLVVPKTVNRVRQLAKSLREVAELVR